MVSLFGRRKAGAAPPAGARSPVSRILRVLRRVLGGLLVLVLLFVGALLLGPTRGVLLDVGLWVAGRFLPGEIHAGRTAWSSPGHIVLEEVLWVTRGEARTDTLLDLVRLDLGLDVRALRSREARIDSLVADLRLLDVAGLARAFAPDSSSTAGSDTAAARQGDPAPVPWFDPGPMPGVPSAGIGRLRVHGARLLLPGGWRLENLDASARFEAGAGHDPTGVVDHLAVRVRGTVPDSAGARPVVLDLTRLAAAGRLDAASLVGGDFASVSGALDSLEIRVERFAVDPGPAVEDLAISARGTVEEGRRARLTLADLSAAARGAVGGGEAWEGTISRLMLTATVEVDRDAGGDPAWRAAALEDLTLGRASFRLGDRLAVDDVALEAGASAGVDRPGRLLVDHFAARVRGAIPDSTRPRTWGLDLDHLGLGAEVRGSRSGGGPWRLTGATLDSLDLDLTPVAERTDPAGWHPTEPLHLDTRGRVDRDGRAYVADLELDFLLPGTAHFPSLLPADFPHEAFGALAGTFSLDGRYDDPRVEAELTLDLGETAWLDAGRVGLTVDADRNRVAAGDLSGLVAVADSLALGLYGAGIFLDGGVDRGELDLTLQLGLDDPRLLRFFLGAEDGGDSLAVGADLVLGGSLAAPEVAGWVAGTVLLPEAEVPSFRLDLQGDARRLDAELRARGGIRYGGAALDSFHVSVTGSRDTAAVVTGGVALEAWAGQHALALGGAVGADSLRTVRIDSLLLRSGGRSFGLVRPATLTMGPEPTGFRLTPFAMAGDPGEIEIEGHWGADDYDLGARADLLLVEEMLQEFLPSPIWSVEGGVDLAIDADLNLAGTPREPDFAGYARVDLLPHRDHPALGVDLDFALARGDTAGLYANLALTSGDSLFLAGSALWPGRADLDTGRWLPQADRDITVDIPATQLSLQRLNRFLPEDVSLNGTMEVGLDLDIPVAAASPDTAGDSPAPGKGSVRASLKCPDMRVTLPNRSRMELGMDLAAEGSLADPRVSGRIDISSAFFRIPEIPRSLHPVEGPSLLWSLRDSVRARADSSAAAADSFSVFVTPENPYGLRPSGPAFLPELDLKVVFPRNVRVNGYGMDLELEGDVHVARGYDADGFPGPSLSGHVRIRSGSIQFMNRVFTPRRGNVDFTGDVPPNPHLEMQVEATVSGTLVKILVSGRANDPIIDLTSEPEMPQEDVMAVLLFGRPLNDLDNSQRDHMQDEGDPAKELRENLAGLAMVFGTAGLQNQVSNTLGVDMVQLGSDSSGGSTLMVGKFISPELMVKYHASLEKSGTYFMTLEYTLSRYFKLVSTYGQGEEASGAELQWSKRY